MMWKFVEFLMELKERLSFTGPMEKRISLRYLQGNALHEVSLEGRYGGSVELRLRPQLIVRGDRGTDSGEGDKPTQVPLASVTEITVEEWDLDDPESVITSRWLRDGKGRLRPVHK